MFALERNERNLHSIFNSGREEVEQKEEICGEKEIDNLQKRD